MIIQMFDSVSSYGGPYLKLKKRISDFIVWEWLRCGVQILF